MFIVKKGDKYLNQQVKDKGIIFYSLKYEEEGYTLYETKLEAESAAKTAGLIGAVVKEV